MVNENALDALARITSSIGAAPYFPSSPALFSVKGLDIIAD
jgi:hypothetical protein